MTAVELDDTDRRLLGALLATDREVARTAACGYLGGVDLQTIPWSQARLLPLLYKRMTALGEPTPDLVRGTYRRAWTENQLRFRAVAATMAKLDGAGIRNVVLKGASLVPSYGGDWGVRDMSDVDLLVPVAQVGRTAAVLAADGWRPRLGRDVTAALARVVDRRHSWAFEHPDGHQVDLHWHVLQTSRGPRSDTAFLAGAVPLVLGTVTTRRLCDGDLLLHVLEHGTHGEETSQLQWIVDAVHLIRAWTDPADTAARLLAQARTHRLVTPLQRQLEVIVAETAEPAAALLLQRLSGARQRRPSRSGTTRGRLDEFRRGGTRLDLAVRAQARETLDVALVRRPMAWAVYVVTGRRPRAEQVLTRVAGPLTGAAVVEVPRSAGEWWDVWRPEVADALCGPGWWYCEPEARGVWTEGTEARLSISLIDGRAAAVDMQLSLLGRHGGPARKVSVRAGGRTHAVLEATEGHSWHEVTIPLADGEPTAEISIRIDRPARPIDLGLPHDTRRLGALLHRVRLR